MTSIIFNMNNFICYFMAACLFINGNGKSAFGAVDLRFNYGDAGYFLKSLSNHDHGPSVEESTFVVNNGHSSATLQASYGPYAAQQGVAPSLVKAAQVNDSHIVASMNVGGGLYDVSGHVVSRSLMLDSPVLQVLFHASYANSGYDRRHQQSSASYNISNLWCAKIHVQRDSTELSGSCVVDPTDLQSDVCLAQLAMPREWWESRTGSASPQAVTSLDVFYSISGPYSDYSQCSTDDTENTAAPEVVEDTTVKTFLSTVTLLQSQLTFQEVQEDQHILVYIPEKSFYPGARFRVPVKLQAESDLELFVVKVKARHGLRILGAEPSKPDSWRVTVEMNHKRRSAVVTASVQDQTTYTKTDRVQPIFDWMFEVEDGASDADDSGRIILSLEYEMNSNMQETYGSVENRVVARLHIQQDHISSIVPVVKTTELRNTAMLTGITQNYSMKIYSIGQRGTISDVTQQTTCHSGDEETLKVSPTCNVVYLDGTETRGSPSVSVIAKYGRHTRFLFFKVWVPAMPLIIELSDSRLSQIKGWKALKHQYTSSRTDFGTLLTHSSLLPRENTPTEETEEMNTMCALKFQQSVVEVYAHFYVPEADVGTQFLVHRKALLRVTDLVRPRMRIADGSIAVLSGNVVEGMRQGRTEIQVTSQMGRVIGAHEIKVGNSKVTLERMEVDVITGLNILVDDQSDLPGTLSVRVLKQSKLTRQYQEGVLDISLYFSDGTTMPLRHTPPADFFIKTDTLNNHVVTFGPMLSPYQPQVIALGQGKGELLKLSLELGDECQRKKSKSLAVSYVYAAVDFSKPDNQEKTQNDDHRGNRRYSGSSGGDLGVKSGGSPKDVYNGRNNKDMLNEGGVKFDAGQRSKSYNQLLDDSKAQSTSDTPSHEAQQQRVSTAHEDMSALEVGMYALLGVFCLAVVAFMANCSVYVWRYRKRHQDDDKWVHVSRGAPVQAAADWVWIGRQTLERNAVNTRCSQTLMSDADFNGNHGNHGTNASNTGSLVHTNRPGLHANPVNRASTLPRHVTGIDKKSDNGSGNGSNRNSMVSTYKGSECSIRITSNPHNDSNPLLGTLAARRARDQQNAQNTGSLTRQSPPRDDSMSRHSAPRDDNANEIESLQRRSLTPINLAERALGLGERTITVASLADSEDTSSFVSDESTPLTASSAPAGSSTTLGAASSCSSSCTSTSSSDSESDSENDSFSMPNKLHITEPTGPTSTQLPLKFLNGNYPPPPIDSDDHPNEDDEEKPKDVQWDYEAMGMDYNELMDYFDNLKETSA